MATTEQIAFVRDLVSEPDDSNGWTSTRIGQYIDNSPSLRLAAGDIWGVKASAYSKMVDISESGSSRKESDLLKNALLLQKAMQDSEAAADTDPDAGPRPRTRAIIRP